MDYKIINSNNKGKQNAILVDVTLLEYLYDMLRNVDGTCVWSPSDNQYIKVSDIDETVIEEIGFMLKINRLK